MANQQKRIKSIIEKNIREILQFEIKNEVGFLTVTNVIVSDDHSYVKVYVSFFDHPNDNFMKLEKTKGYVRSSLAKKMSLRRAPEITFILDDGFLKAEKLEKLLKKDSEEISNISKK